MKLARTNPTIIRRIEVAAFFPAIPNTNPSARRSTIPMIAAMVPGMTKLKTNHLFLRRSSMLDHGVMSLVESWRTWDVFGIRSMDDTGVQLKLVIVWSESHMFQLGG